MQKWKCSVCGKVFLVDRDEPHSPQLEEAMKHALEHVEHVQKVEGKLKEEKQDK